MSTTGNEIRRKAIRRTLSQRAGSSPDASAIAEATLGTWQEVAARLEPLIGTGGVDILFGRSLNLTSRSFPCLALASDYGDSVTSLASFRATVENMDVAVAIEASNALLVIFTEMLATMVGESLTERLLDMVWVSPSGSEMEKEAWEAK